MTDFSQPYRGVAYFGIWASETADDYGRRAAAIVLTGAVELCADEDMRADREVMDALDYLAAQGEEKAARRFRQALNLPHPEERQQAAADTVKALKRSLERSGPT